MSHFCPVLLLLNRKLADRSDQALMRMLRASENELIASTLFVLVGRG